jgi:hypothetical protein
LVLVLVVCSYLTPTVPNYQPKNEQERRC